MNDALQIDSNSNQFEPSVVGSAACLSLFGWEYEYVAKLDTVKCKMCFRNCLLLNFKSLQRSQQQESVEIGKTDKEINKIDSLVDQGELIFDAETQHQPYCSWITGNGKLLEGRTQEELARRRPGWYIVLEAIVKLTTPIEVKTSLDIQRIFYHFQN